MNRKLDLDKMDATLLSLYQKYDEICLATSYPVCLLVVQFLFWFQGIQLLSKARGTPCYPSGAAGQLPPHSATFLQTSATTPLWDLTLIQLEFSAG